MTSLEKNKFYNLLLTTYRKKYSEAAHKCHIICIPINDSYDLNTINDKFISAHILKPSPLLKSHFVAANNKHNFDVEIDGQLLKVTRGFGNQNIDNIPVLSEEMAYNSQNKEYRILICETPLINSSNCKLNYNSKKSISQNNSLISFFRFLHNVSPNLTNVLKAKVEKLMNTYIVLPNYIEDAANRIKVVIDWGIQCFRSVSTLPEVAKTEFYLESAIESYVIGLTYPKLFDAVNKHFEKEDKLLNHKFVELCKRNINPVDFGAQKAFESFTINTIIIDELSRIENKITPLEKLHCLRKTLDLMSEQMTKSFENKYFPLSAKRGETVCIMSDDLIATVICVLTAIKLKRFESEINFIQTFSWNLPQNNEFGYSLVTFEVAKEFIKNYNLNQNYSTNISKNEMKSLESCVTSGTNLNTSSMSSPLDRELEKISKMIDNSNISLTSNSSKSSRNEVNEELGEFLGSLSQNNFAVGFGKQF